jgi:hypothetical protein
MAKPVRGGVEMCVPHKSIIGARVMGLRVSRNGDVVVIRIEVQRCEHRVVKGGWRGSD